MGGAARAIGNSDLETKFEDSIKLLERPNTVVFNPSYVATSWSSPSVSHADIINCRSQLVFIDIGIPVGDTSRQVLWTKGYCPSCITSGGRIYYEFLNDFTEGRKC